MEAPGVHAPRPARADRPRTAMALWIGVAGAVAALATFVAGCRSGLAPAAVALLTMGAAALPPLLFDGVPHVVARAGAGGNPWRRERLVAKLAGALATIGLATAAVVVFPFFRRPGLDWLVDAAPVALALASPAALGYVLLADRLAESPDDGLAALGRALLGRAFDEAQLLDFLRTLAIKLFFFTLMFSYLAADAEFFRVRGLPVFDGTHADAEKINRLIFTCDVALAALGYLAALKLFDWHVREADPTASGWLACLVCYEPFYPAIARAFIAYHGGEAWRGALAEGSLAYWLWMGSVIASNLVYLFATVAFGPLFSNLTRRRIITSGPYALGKHPAYVAKNIGWWLAEAPGLIAGAPLDSLRRAAMLAVLTAIYRARAVTEERLLSRDPVYVAYAAWIAEHGLIARARRLLRRLAPAPLRS